MGLISEGGLRVNVVLSPLGNLLPLATFDAM